MSAKAENSETVRRGTRRRKRKFVGPRPDATLSHLVKIKLCNRAYLIFYATSLSSIPIKKEAWTIVHTASTFYKRYVQRPLGFS
jgi:hypothetical protein